MVAFLTHIPSIQTQVIDKIHHNFFSNKQLHEVDVWEFLADEQQNILKDCKVVFSGVSSVGEAHPHLHPL